MWVFPLHSNTSTDDTTQLTLVHSMKLLLISITQIDRRKLISVVEPFLCLTTCSNSRRLLIKRLLLSAFSSGNIHAVCLHLFLVCRILVVPLGLGIVFLTDDTTQLTLVHSMKLLLISINSNRQKETELK